MKKLALLFALLASPVFAQIGAYTELLPPKEEWVCLVVTPDGLFAASTGCEIKGDACFGANCVRIVPFGMASSLKEHIIRPEPRR